MRKKRERTAEEKKEEKVTASELLFKAIKSGNVDHVRFCLESGVDVNTRKRNNEPPLYVAIKEGHLDIIKLLIQFKADVNSGVVHLMSDTPVCTPIHIAAHYGKLEIVKLLKENGADLNQLCVWGKRKNTPLFLAAGDGYLRKNDDTIEDVRDGRCFKYLLDNGADLHCTIKNCFYVNLDAYTIDVKSYILVVKIIHNTEVIKKILNQVIITEKDEEKFMPPEEDRLSPDDKYTWKLKGGQTWSLKEFYKCGVCHEWKSKEKIEQDVPVKSYRCQHYYCTQCASKIDTCPECRRPFQLMPWVQKRMKEQIPSKLRKRTAEEMMV